MAKSKAAAEVAPSRSKEDDERERKYRAEDGLRTLTRAEEVKADPDLMRDVAAHAKEQAEVAARSAHMVKSGLISDKQKTRMSAAKAKAGS